MKASEAYTRLIKFVPPGVWGFGRRYVDARAHVMRRHLDRSKYNPKPDEGSPAWRRAMKRQEYLT